MTLAATVHQPKQNTDYATRETSQQFPRRYLVYMAGIGTRLFLPMMQEFVNRLGQQVDAITFVIGDRHSYRWARTQLLDGRIQLLYQHEHLDPFRRPARVDVDQLSRWEERYGVPNLWRYVLVHRMINHLSDQAKLAYLQTYLEYFESLALRYQPEVLITGAPDSMVFLLAYQVFKQRGAIPLLLSPGRIPGCSFIVDNDTERIPGLEQAYAALRERDLTADEHQQVHRLRDVYRAHRIRPHYYGLGPRTKALPSPARLVRLIKRRIEDEGRYVDEGIWQMVQRSVLTRWRTPWQRLDLSRYAAARIGDEPFFYYPLHYEPESAVDVFSTYYRDQLRVIRLVASALPVEHLLYVKENPNMPIGTRPRGYYRRVATIPGVRLLPTTTDSYEVIARCRGVVTLAGTTGFEALCCGKPVLMFGHAFYEVFREGVFRSAGLEDAAEMLQRMSAHPHVDETLLEKFLAAVLQRTYAVECEQYKPQIEGPENVRALTSCLINELAFRLQNSHCAEITTSHAS